MRKITINFNNLNSIQAFHDYISKELEFSKDYNGNLDSLKNEISKLDKNRIKFEVIKGGSVLNEMQELIESILMKK
ncbi:barstar family protein [Peptostreptococcus equinus]|uniref:Barstar domain protein n=1 Tax=Peptostreptococcus equinus TaxID=3003601 RepID=A0ABY7JPM8_9FIRM|nr:barstar domain protein [Peptostreptococcus sp. CBA3647]WAW14444.1 barstar domain protein [Peptostreptococcus sp. CBA3647]